MCVNFCCLISFRPMSLYLLSPSRHKISTRSNSSGKEFILAFGSGCSESIMEWAALTDSTVRGGRRLWQLLFVWCTPWSRGVHTTNGHLVTLTAIPPTYSLSSQSPLPKIYNLPKQLHQLETKYSTAWANKGDFTFKTLQSTAQPIGTEMLKGTLITSL